jgi:hypothetical protein
VHQYVFGFLPIIVIEFIVVGVVIYLLVPKGWPLLLAESRLREVWNHRLRFGRSGVLFILLEVFGTVTIILWLIYFLPPKVFYDSGSVADMALAQVPIALPSMVSLFALIGFLAAYCYIIILIQSGGMLSLVSVTGVLAGSVLLAVLMIAATGLILKYRYSL